MGSWPSAAPDGADETAHGRPMLQLRKVAPAPSPPRHLCTRIVADVRITAPGSRFRGLRDRG